MGLSTVYGIVKQHKGHIAVISKPGAGATFTVYLPSAGRRPDHIPIEEAATPYSRGSETIVVVEDEEIVRNLTTEFLELLGYRVHAVGHPEEALKLCEEHHGSIHLLLTDIVLPQMDGTRLYKAVALLRPDIRVVYVSGAAQDSGVDKNTLRSGGHFLKKPFALDALATKVREVLDGTGAEA